MIEKKINYIAKRYISRQKSLNKRLVNGYHIQKNKRIAQPFSAFYPKLEYLRSKRESTHTEELGKNI